MPQALLSLLTLIVGFFLTIPVWEASKPLLQWFLDHYGHTFPGLESWLVALTPFMVYLVVVLVLFTLLQGLLLFCRQTFEEWTFRRWQRTVGGRPRGGR